MRRWPQILLLMHNSWSKWQGIHDHHDGSLEVEGGRNRRISDALDVCYIYNIKGHCGEVIYKNWHIFLVEVKSCSKGHVDLMFSVCVHPT